MQRASKSISYSGWRKECAAPVKRNHERQCFVNLGSLPWTGVSWRWLSPSGKTRDALTRMEMFLHVSFGQSSVPQSCTVPAITTPPFRRLCGSERCAAGHTAATAGQRLALDIPGTKLGFTWKNATGKSQAAFLQVLRAENPYNPNFYPAHKSLMRRAQALRGAAEGPGVA